MLQNDVCDNNFPEKLFLKSFSKAIDYKIPILIITGEFDMVAGDLVTQDWLRKIKPFKEFE